MRTKLVSLVICLSTLSGCATIMGSDTQVIPVGSTPSDALISITDEKGTQIFKGLTPTTVSLNKADGTYWGKKSYTVTISKSGFQDQVIPVTATANGWYLGGNLLFGGLIGWFIVDPMTGKMYTLPPEAISATMNTKQAHNNTGKDGGISVVLLQDVPKELQVKMVRVQ